MALRIALVDDEPVARMRLGRLLREAGCEVLAEFEDGRQLLAWLRDGHKPDALFLDIALPGPSGMELLAELRDGPPVIFVTSNAEHAVAAFEHRASDYLVKPVTADRLANTLARLEGFDARKADTPQPAAAAGSTRFPVKAGDGKLLLELKRVAYFEVIDQVVWAWAGGKKFRCAWTSLSDVESVFPGVAFLRIQRNIMLRPEAVLGLRTLPTGRKAVLLPDGVELEASRNAAHHLKEKLGL
ncbi:MAG: response regulator transcription factor [Holophagaceae bacterium]|nr:response regulator transcription factor [Holophagaceae bacterium]